LGAAVRIATWNDNSMPARLDFVLDFVSTRRPDVLCVQELKIDDAGFPHLAFANLGYSALTFGQSQWNGVGVLVNKDVDPEASIVATGLPGQEAMGARLMTVRVRDLFVTSVYIPNGKTVSHPDFQAKLLWLDAFVDYVRTRVDPASLAVVAGDFNVVPADLDTWEPALHQGHIFHTDAERARIKRVEDHGLVDLFRDKNPDLQAFSWWDYRAGAFHKKQGLRIDLVYGTDGVRRRVTGASIDRDFRKKREGRIPSDHAPVIVELT
jgi:exodeoxyribonuclease III